MGNFNTKQELQTRNICPKRKSLNIYVKGKNGECGFVYSYDNILEPHFRKIEYVSDFESEILAIFKSLECLERKNINFKINLYTESQEVVNYIYDCILYRNKDECMLSKILYLVSDKNVKFYCKKFKEDSFIQTILNF